jgi:hypothetical protein
LRAHGVQGALKAFHLVTLFRFFMAPLARFIVIFSASRLFPMDADDGVFLEGVLFFTSAN